jgi:hypothetical protein
VKAVLGIVVGLALATAPVGHAKGPDSAQMCGKSACTTTTTIEDVNVLALWGSGFDARAEPAAAPFYTVELRSTRGSKQEWSFLYVPSARAVKVIRADFSGGVSGVTTQNDWVTPTDDVLAVYDRVAGDLAPHEASEAWVASSDGGRDVPWLPLVVLVAALVAAAALFSRQRFTRRAARLAHD